MKFLFSIALVVLASTINAQSAADIIAKSNEALGGKNWATVNSIKYETVVEQGGMKIPLEIAMMRDGRLYTKISIQGMEIVQGAYDGTTLWSTNFMTQKAEKAEAEEIENTKRTATDFPSALHTYEKSGYKVSLEGEETVDGVVCHKIKMDKKTKLSEGVEVPNVEYYYIDKDSHALIMTESEITDGEMKGKMVQSKYSDYQEVNGVYIAYSQTMGIRDGESQAITFNKVEVNGTVDENTFKFPGE